jgi:threonine/homoserine/homoserine lactone efflux protein
MDSAARNALIAIASTIVLVVLLAVALTGSGRAAERSWLVLVAVAVAAVVALVRFAWRSWRRRRARQARPDADAGTEADAL